jgi:hypothetical protein
VRVHDHDLDAKFVLGHPNGLPQIRVVRDDDGLVAATPEGVEEQIRGQVHVRALLLGLDDLDHPTATWPRIRQRHPCDVAQVVPEVDGDERERAERAEVGLLALRPL